MHGLIVYSLVVLISIGVGFGLGRVKNLAKLKAFQDHINVIDAAIGNEVQVASARVRSMLDDLKKKL